MKRLRKVLQKGFTLTELVIVLVIIAFLVLMVLFMTRFQLFKGNDARRKGDLRKLQTAVEEYQSDNNCYPIPTLVDMTCEEGNGLEPYIDKIPCDPISQASYLYDYEDSACPSWYRLYAKLDGSEGIYGPESAYNYAAGSANAPDPNLSEGDFYGCIGGTCVPIYWDSSRPGPECDPNSRSVNCDGICGPPVTECKPWNQ